jgi:serine protease
MCYYSMQFKEKIKKTKYFMPINKKYLFLFILFFALIVSAIDSKSAGNNPSYELKYEPGQIIIKFSENSDIGFQWLINGRKGQIEYLQDILGDHTSEGYINDALLFGLRKKEVSNNIISSFERMCLIRYSTPFDPVLIASKLRKMPGIEYVEAKPISNFTADPNDSLFSEQYYLQKVRAVAAWERIGSTDSILVAIVDTGIDYNHEDLKNSIYSNPGETGKDKNNNDKSINGIDDDQNGFVDDWHGWDFVSSTSSDGMDNDPYPGHKHGTHVGGTVGAMTNNKIGIAATFPLVKLLPVKVGKDDVNSTSVHNGYQGILYAAIMGAKVINCSWGSGGISNSDYEILQTAEQLGALIVAAAGNNGSFQKFYPAGYLPALSVAAITSLDRKTSFSNYHPSVDISAPGNDILATVPNNRYQSMDGTSMAAPIVSAIAAMVIAKFPELTPMQVGEHIKASATNIDEDNPGFEGLLGRGRIDAFDCVYDNIRKSIAMIDFDYDDSSGDGVINPDETVWLDIKLQNVLAELQGVYLKPFTDGVYSPIYNKDSIYIGNMGSLIQSRLNKLLAFELPSDIPFDYKLLLEFDLYDQDGFVNRVSELVNVKPSYRTMNANKITLTLNSRGNFGFNDYADNTQGDGLRYDGSQNLIYEGGLIAARSVNKISNNVRGNSQSKQDKDFISADVFKTKEPGALAAEEGFGVFGDQGANFKADVDILQDVYQFDEPGKEDFVLIKYRVINTSSESNDSLYLALFLDLDLGNSGKNDKINFQNENGFGYIRSMVDDNMPWLGVSMISQLEYIFYAIDNNGESPTSPSLWDGFRDSEKWSVMIKGIGREASGVLDCSMIIGAGPFKCNAGDTATVVFSLFGGKNLADLISIEKETRNTLPEIGEKISKYYPKPTRDSILSIYPNPSSGDITVEFSINDDSEVELLVIDELGRTVAILQENERFVKNLHVKNYVLENLSAGRYYLQLKANGNSDMMPFEYTGYK